MPLKWKKGPRFKPEVVLATISGVRTVNSEGGVSFSSFVLEDCLPALQSMLEFPAVASEVDKANLVWRGLTRVKSELTKENFLKAVNQELNENLAINEREYFLLTAISCNKNGLPKQIERIGAKIRFLDDYPIKFQSERDILLREHQVEVPATPNDYCKVTIEVKAKSASSAMHKGMRALDLQRALWCFIANPYMQLGFGKLNISPINVIRLGSQHTVHQKDGKRGADGLWFETNFRKNSIFRMESPEIFAKNYRWLLRKIAASPYRDRLIGSLIRFVRALDEPDQNTAFLRLWGALEAVASPNQADYDKLVKRCSFIFADSLYHQQILEHLREYRNSSVHSGEESDRARTHCFQLQFYFKELIRFHLQNSKLFRTLDEANFFLDSPGELEELKRRVDLANKAVLFRTPK